MCLTHTAAKFTETYGASNFSKDLFSYIPNAYLSFLFSKNRWSEALLAIGNSAGKQRERDLSQKHIEHHGSKLSNFKISQLSNNKYLPPPRGWGGGWTFSWIALLPRLGGTALVPVATELVESTEFLAKACWLLVWLREVPLLANIMTSFALSAGNSLNTITCPP